VNLPQDFIKKMKHLLKDEAESFFNTYSKEKLSGLRLNTLKITVEEWEKITPFKLERVPFVETGFYYNPDFDQPGKHPYHAAGLYYIQEPSAMFVAEQLRPKKKEKVLDLCAAPGGKTTHLAALMENEGLLIANEIHPKRAKALSENIERMGIKNAVVLNESPEKLAERLPGYFDKILVDAPCSGEGMFRKDEEAIEFWSEDHVERCARQQLRILDSAYQMLKEGGVLVYSTCTFSPEENEQTVEAFLTEHPDMELLPIEKRNGVVSGNPEWSMAKNQELAKTARLWPHLLQGEGHFVARFMKNGSSPKAKIKHCGKGPTKNELGLFIKFCNDTLKIHIPGPFFMFKNQLYALPDNCFDFSGIKVVRPGLHLGEFKKNRFEPNHSLALALTEDQVKFTYPITLDDDRWKHYLKGETLPGNGDRGWVVITIDSFPLGWGKEAKGTIKNFYPKGLRWFS
jgi:NOL1/NOP2/sun family putative RNA methylase